MANEIVHDYISGLDLYACRFKQDKTVFLTDGSSSEVWGTGGHTAADYDVAMVEEAGVSGHYTCSFDASSNIAAGVYPVTVYVGSPPVNGDTVVGRGTMNWDGTAEMNASTILVNVNAAITAAHVTTDADIAAIAGAIGALVNLTADDVLDEVVEGTLTLRQIHRLLLSALAGLASGGGTPILTFRDIADTKDRITATVDKAGNRTAVIRDAT